MRTQHLGAGIMTPFPGASLDCYLHPSITVHCEWQGILGEQHQGMNGGCAVQFFC